MHSADFGTTSDVFEGAIATGNRSIRISCAEHHAKRLFSFGKSENARIFGGTDESVPYGCGCLKDQQTAIYRAVAYIFEFFYSRFI